MRRKELKKVVTKRAIILLALGGVLLNAWIASAISPWLSLVLPAGIVLSAVALRNPFPILVMIVFLIPLENFTVVWGGSLNRYLTLPLLMGWLLKTFDEGKRVYLAGPTWLMVTWFVFSQLSFLWASTTSSFVNLFFGFLLAIVLMMITSDLVDSRKRLKWVLNALVSGSFVFLVIWLLTGRVNSQGFYIPHVGTGYLSTYSAMLGLVIACFLPIAFHGRDFSRLVTLIGLLVAIYLSFTIGMRRIFLSIPLVTLALLLVRKPIPWKAIVVVLSLIAVLGFGWTSIVSQLPAPVQRRFRLNDVIETGGSGRLMIYANAFRAWKSSPLAGIGLGSFPFYTSVFYNERNFAHNAYLEVFAETGLIGSLMWGGAVFLILRDITKIYRSPRRETDRLLVSIPFALVVYLLVNGTVDGYYNYRPFWFAMGLGIAAARVITPSNSAWFTGRDFLTKSTLTI